MSNYGTVERYATKKALAAAVAADPDAVIVCDTSAFNNRGYVPVSALADDRTAVIVGPDPYTERRWYARVTRAKSGTVKIT